MVLPSYIELAKSGQLQERIDIFVSKLQECQICPRKCGVNRLKGEKGFCRSGRRAIVSSAHAHFGEEPVLVGTKGSGTIFFTFCNLGCIFCQNYEISHLGYGEEMEPSDLANLMIGLQKQGCHNINFVTPTHFVAQILEALSIAVEKGLKIPLVYNCGGYESVETIKLLDGIFDIYMPDIKYADSEVAEKYSKASDYPSIVMEAVKQMHLQVGDLQVDENGIAMRGLLVRHLVLPNNLAGSKKVFSFLASEISKNTYLNIMAQYRPMYKARFDSLLNRSITPAEYSEAVEVAYNLGLKRLDERPPLNILFF